MVEFLGPQSTVHPVSLSSMRHPTCPGIVHEEERLNNNSSINKQCFSFTWSSLTLPYKTTPRFKVSIQ